jgi:hypothetical protein
VKLPNAERAEVPEQKLRDYLLSTEHAIGRYKARFFARLGFTRANWKEFRDRLLQLAREDAEPGPETEFGQKFLVSGRLVGPKGAADVVIVWILRAEDDAPRLVTVYPR